MGDKLSVTAMLFPGQGFAAQSAHQFRGGVKRFPTAFETGSGSKIDEQHKYNSTINHAGRAVSRRGRVIGGSASGCASPYCGIPSQGRGRAKAMGQDGKAVGRLKEHASCGAGIDAAPNKEPYREPQRFGSPGLG